ncbi:hypothetical protein B9Z55_018134 [Caenorhabditis nigoni]|uniref:UDP-glucuronosyltransferase n=1 Tax=Caenorhabditis nigoni TaxID=1611254 RepID=A0A2G5TCP8_9PELO|nr:hypothetical protein B9Z55_018134 [Caenorhabditis nigoni]
MFSWFIETMILSCENFLRNQSTLEELKTRKFDVAIAEPFSVCGLALFEELGIKKTILVSSCTHIDLILPYIGEPEEFSWVPSLSSQLVQENKASFHKLFEAEKRACQKAFGTKIPDWKELMASASLFFTNTIPFIDYPRATIQKTIPVGGITVDLEKIRGEKLTEEWEEVLGRREKTMMISFGSIMRSAGMPEDWKSGILATIKSMPNVTFIWKYESEDLDFAQSAENIHFSMWVPQTALLADPRLSGFLTHGGLGSTNELAHLGKPAIMVPIFGDQTRNANMLARHGSVIVLHKKDLTDEEKVGSAIRSILYEDKYMKNAVRVAEMLKNQPTNPKDTVVKYTEFVARFGPFPQMDPYARKLNYLQKNFLDIYFTLTVLVLISALSLFLILKCTCNFKKIKTD